MGEKLLDGAGAVVAVVFAGLLFALEVGGISYRKECVNDAGRVAKSWTFTWFAPIPYLFRPDDPGCVVHTGTRVALNAVGIAKFDDTTASTIAERAVERANPDDDDAYWAKVGGALADYGNRNESITDINEGLRSVDTLRGQLADLSPPTKYADAHAALIAALRQMEEHGKALRKAAEAQDSEAFERAKHTIVPDARSVQRAVDKLNMVHAAG